MASAAERAEVRALAAAARERSAANRVRSRSVRESARAAGEGYREVRRHHLKVMEASVQAVPARALRAERLAADPDAMMDQVLATSVTLMALRPKVDPELAPVVDAALKACGEVTAHLGGLAHGEFAYAYLWQDDLREIDEITSAIYQHVVGGDGGL